MKTASLILSLTLALTSSSSRGAEPSGASIEPIDFNRDIQPILADVCFKCHGPDEQQRVSDLRLDVKDGALADLGGYRAIVPGQLESSELHRRITSDDPEQRMPPADSGRTLSDEQIALLADWIRQGATWQDHWAFVAPELPTLPKAKDGQWGRNEIDNFILARLEQEGLKPSPEANKSTLIRRVSLDLTGLPPTPEEVEDFLADESPGAYEKVVDRLLGSPRYGERMAMEWLDAARYADTSGYQTDGTRYMWRWRDWVIEALNDNMPFDQFTIEQIAGDLLPPQVEEQTVIRTSSGVAWREKLIRDPVRLKHLIASAFHRNHRGNAEGGIVPEEYQVEYVVDRVETTFTVWLGLTFGCSRCHDHKYDPLSQEEFYQVAAFFNNVPEYGRAIKDGNSPPYIKAPTPEQLKQLDGLDARLADAQAKVENLKQEIDSLQASWEQTWDTNDTTDWSVSEGLLSYFSFDGHVEDEANEEQAGKFFQGEETFAPGRLGQAARFGDASFVDAGDLANFGYFDKFALAAWIYPEAETGTIISRMTPVSQGSGYGQHLEDGYIHFNMVKRWLDDSLRVQTRRKLELSKWHHVVVTYDGSRIVEGIKIYIDGQLEPFQANQAFINQTFAAEEPLRIGAGQSNFSGIIDEARIYDRDLSPQEAAILSVPESISQIVALSADQRSLAQAAKLRSYFLDTQAPESMRLAHSELKSIQQQRRAFIEAIPTLMVMQEVPDLRETHVLNRGQYDQPVETVSPGVPTIFPSLPTDAPTDRRGLAAWLVSAANPLTARVAVNRYWQMYFGTGLVKTTEDFGAQGERPSHPKLLDWLATEFVRTGWDVKAMQRLIVTSAAYRQSSRSTAEQLARDPENRLLSRGPRIRLSAEMVRDQALAISGLLTHRLGGPSVFPYQPEGLWKEIATNTDYHQSHGEDLYRRSLYTFWKRTVAPPTMVTLDATAREACTMKRARTNTPLQALVLMNETAFVEAARAMAGRIMRHGGDTLDSRIQYAYQLALARQPDAAESKLLAETFKYYRNEFAANAAAAEQLLSVGEFHCDPQLDVAELASYTMVASMILNLDEMITKE